LILERGPVYAESDIVIDSTDEGPNATAKLVMNALKDKIQPGQES